MQANPGVCYNAVTSLRLKGDEVTAPTAKMTQDTLRSRDKLLEKIQDRVLWLSMNMIHYANSVRPNPDGIKVGGHQASCASVMTILTSLFFDYMKPGDRIAIKPHASPVFHAIQFLLGNLDQEYLKTLREFHGLQAYPSRTKDPDPVDFSTGSVGLGAIAPNFAALTGQYMLSHQIGPSEAGQRYIALIGDAELDEGSVWETIVEPHLRDLPNVMWVVDLNRQSLDRVIPGIRVQLWREMFSANDWRVIDAKYGTRLQAAFAEPRGELLRECIDEMSNEAYQRLLRLPLGQLRESLSGYSRYPGDLRQLIARYDDQELQELLQNLGGHDFSLLRAAFSEADVAQQPSVVFAYTLKGWRLPVVGDPQNHSVVLSHQDMEKLREELGVAASDVWSGFDPGTPEGRTCIQIGGELRSRGGNPKSTQDLALPPTLGHEYGGQMSTQQALGRILSDIAWELPAVAKRIVTVSPDVASSTNLGGWINKVGVWNRRKGESLSDDGVARSLRWEEGPQGQHIELGICENNLFMLLGQLGLAFETSGELLFPIGTLYDPFICRAVETLLYNTYLGGRFMVVGTPSGISLSREGAVHQSILTPSVGLELPEIIYYEPCFAQELEWIVLYGLEQIRLRKQSFYLRLTTKRVDQGLLPLPEDAGLRELLRQQVLMGAYRLVDRSVEAEYQPGDNGVHIFATGPMVPEAVEASNLLKREGVLANVINVTSPDRLFRVFQESVSNAMGAKGPWASCLEEVLAPEERRAPLVTVLDGHPHVLAWLGGALGTRAFPLGVSQFGQSGSLRDLYREYQIDANSIMTACFAALEAEGE